MKITRNPFRRRMTLRNNLAVFGLVGGLVLTSFASPPVAQAPRSSLFSSPSLSAAEINSSMIKTKLRLSANQTQEKRGEKEKDPAVASSTSTPDTQQKRANSAPVHSLNSTSSSSEQKQSSEKKDGDPRSRNGAPNSPNDSQRREHTESPKERPHNEKPEQPYPPDSDDPGAETPIQPPGDETDGGDLPYSPHNFNFSPTSY
ncbi:hypothetical protein SAMN05444487_11760 [Marininema mesophilum]|uniref:Uncharacterized protein n=1 Tax=Marininema mesophilum TaxID=1048340 RepID=A0A1H3BMH3_9BACL|nr:hypothetical protein [Marininema mesophilum]SDX43116.1 hypothetical protein SAMN05444487_11760 [Marininema mesophilum]